MKKRFWPRLFTLLGVYVFVFLVLVFVQWMRSDVFSHKIGSLTVSGKYARLENGSLPPVRETVRGDEYDVDNSAKITFKGLEFLFGDDETAAVCIRNDGSTYAVYPRLMSLTAQYVRFVLAPDRDSESDAAVELNFYLQSEDDAEKLVLSSILPDDVDELKIPFAVLYKSALSKGENGEVYISAEGRGWRFDRPSADFEQGIVILTQKTPVLAYQQWGRQSFNLLEYIVAGSMEKSRFNEIVGLWLNKAYARWSAQIQNTDDEELVSAWVAESARRSRYESALERIPAAFANSASRTYFSSPFMGGMALAAQSKSEFERTNAARLAALLENDFAAFLREYKVFIYLAQRGYNNLFDEAIRNIRLLQPDSLTPDLLPAVFEGWWAWNVWHDGEDNPFEPLAQQARHIVAEQLTKDRQTGEVFMVVSGSIDVMYNAVLGSALAAYGEVSGNTEWAALGRSFILSCLAYSNDAGVLPSALNEYSGNIGVPESAINLDPLNVYKAVALSDYYPHAVGMSTLVRGAWLWTIAPSIAASFANNVLDFAITFPAGGAHYMLVSGIRSFSKIQMRGIDYRSDPQFENWNAPGWVYSPQEQTVLVKLVHKEPVEHIKIYF
ncbi:MAG: hypothetical protein LBG74_03680 [Spirochaetaceae bacterium]|jgi:hypothetical protein|nr:hypothetical protein [Spirochaetaceae bacterium]